MISVKAASVDETFMAVALEEARAAFIQNEVPIGAVVVAPTGVILGRGSNQTEQSNCQSRHAEILAVEAAGMALQDWRLVDCTLYVTVQPCLMCMGLIYLSRINRVVYGAHSPLFGYSLDKEVLHSVYSKHLRGISSGVLGEESQQLIEDFFKKKRIQGEELRSY